MARDPKKKPWKRGVNVTVSPAAYRLLRMDAIIKRINPITLRAHVNILLGLDPDE